MGTHEGALLWLGCWAISTVLSACQSPEVAIVPVVVPKVGVDAERHYGGKGHTFTILGHEGRWLGLAECPSVGGAAEHVYEVRISHATVDIGKILQRDPILTGENVYHLRTEPVDLSSIGAQGSRPTAVHSVRADLWRGKASGGGGYELVRDVTIDIVRQVSPEAVVQKAAPGQYWTFGDDQELFARTLSPGGISGIFKDCRGQVMAIRIVEGLDSRGLAKALSHGALLNLAEVGAGRDRVCPGERHTAKLQTLDRSRMVVLQVLDVTNLPDIPGQSSGCVPP